MSAKTEYVSSERRELTRRFDCAVEYIQQTIADLALTQTFDRNKLKRFQAQVHGLVLPDVRHRVVSIPKSHRQSEKTPLVVSDPSEAYVLDHTFVGHTPNQVEKTLHGYPAMGRADLDRRAHMRMITQTRRAQGGALIPATRFDDDPEVLAVTEVLTWQVNSRIGLHGRPIIFLNMLTNPNLVGTSIYHEFRHVDQYSGTPFYSEDAEADRAISDELDAYDGQAEVNIALLETNLPKYTVNEVKETLEHGIAIAALCNLNPVNDRYAASAPVKQAIKEQGFKHLTVD